MVSVKVTITIEQETLRQLDALVNQRVFPNRSRAVQVALQEKLDRLAGTRLFRECAKLDPRKEMALSEECFATDLALWPEF